MTTTLVADIGGTNTRCALADAQGRLGPVTAFRNAGFAGPAEVLATFLEAAGALPEAAALAVAAPIAGDEVGMVNIGWRFSRGALREQLGLRSLRVVNDFAALAWALRELDPADVAPVGGGTAVVDGPRIVLGPGTGLGLASLVAGRGGWTAVPGEGGHVTLAASDDAEEDVIRAVRARHGHCSAERLVSGPGLALLHAVLHGGETAGPEELGQRHAAGEAKAAATFGMFFRLLGTVASNAALTLGASGGVYIAGGIVPRHLAAFLRSGFRERFEAKGRYRGYLAAIPTFVVTAEHAALRGLAALARAPA